MISIIKFSVLITKKLRIYKKTGVILSDEKRDDEIIQVIDESLIILDKLLLEKANVDPGSIDFRLSAMKTTLLYEKSKILSTINKTDEAETMLANILESINDEIMLKNEMIYIGLRMMNHYAYILTKKEDLKRAQNVLEDTGSLYREAKKTHDHLINFYTSDELFGSSSILVVASDKRNKLERLVTNNFQMLAVVYNKQGMVDKYLENRHLVLSRELEMQEGDPLNWSVKTIDLAKQFLAKNKFRDARHHLATAEKVIRDQEELLKTKEPSDGLIDNFFCQSYHQVMADLANGWVKYGLHIFNVSKMNAVKHFYHKSNQMLEKIWISPVKKTTKNNLTPSNINLPVEGDEPDFAFQQIDLTDMKKRNEKSKKLESIREEEEESCLFCQKEIDQAANKKDNNNLPNVVEDTSELFNFKLLDTKEYEDLVVVCPIENTDQARALFNFTHDWLKRVRSFYTLENHPMEYINAIMDLSELYKYLAFYEEDIESQYAVHKLRADALETLSAILREVRPHWYMAVSIELLRELAEVQLEMMGLNLRRIYSAQTSDSNQSTLALQKIEILGNLHEKLKQVGENIRDDPNFTSDS